MEDENLNGIDLNTCTALQRHLLLTLFRATIQFRATTSVRKCADTRKPPCKYLADLRDVIVKKKSELYKPPLRLYTTFQKY
ncbi:hypothetical protein OUZ56_017018 [Daphnia magna]|uniref:Uncharacterized protein n=1 Tax=Daphnia magna TaxID=35525 RepID=A0ABR0ARY0_9CRUS|nr:hypothetical protein OUZ56_017018 [Daphnia magna]